MTYILKHAFILTLLLTACACGRKSGNLKSKEELLGYRNAEASLVLSEGGELLGKFFIENRTNVSLDKIPQHLINALIATEDVRFYEHSGTDTRSLFRVIFKTILLSKRSSGGGSTITQQLAKNMFGRKEKGLFPMMSNKINEVIMARRLEKVFTKDEILEMYLNKVSFGENVYGIEAASTRFFNKSTGSLKPEEAAVLIGMLKANTYYNPRLHPDNALSRRNIVLQQMAKYNYLTSVETDSLSGLPLVIDYKRSPVSGIADYFLVQVRKEAEAILKDKVSSEGKEWNIETDGLIITTTLHFSLQEFAVRAFREHLSVMQEKLDEQYKTREGKRLLDEITKAEIKRLNLEKRSGVKSLQEIFDWEGTYTDSVIVADSLRQSLTLIHAGLMAMDPFSGGIKAWVGGIDFKTQPYDQILARRQLASVFKPVIYSAALEDGFEPCDYLENDSVKLSGYDDWSPENYDHSFGGKYSLAGALAQSMNIPTFSLFLQVGFGKVDSMWRALGFSFDLDNTPSLSMGTAEASIKEVAVAYASFANGGYLTDSWCVSSIQTGEGEVIYAKDTTTVKRSIMSGKTSILMSAMLQKAVSEGTGISMGAVYGIDFPLAGKTGTSQDYSDAWFAAFNPGLVLVSRAGASSRAVHFNTGAYGSGSALALPLVALTLKQVYHDPALRDQLITDFRPLPPDLAGALDCPDFREKNLFDRIIDIFEKDEKEYDDEARKIERTVKGFLRRIFKKQNND